ncbi:adenylyl-sulfate kinase [Burkholderia sp. BCC1047]|uniref:adenylyl-sulfate kinase n=1 Tax=Burkholderia sp. BCC1047 TaxID=2676299 RepID=UPI00158989EA|nr:adenylyl-sulfate kinase [Burkholderia sp. BCC1047]
MSTGNQSVLSSMKPDHAFVVWLTGVSGAGKSTLSNLLKEQLDARGLRTFLLDGDQLREGLNQDLGFSDADRHENIRRTAEVARLMVAAGLVVIVALISPFRDARAKARARFPQGMFFEVFVDVALDVAEARDPKGLYARARQGTLRQFTGIESTYEKPVSPDVHVRTGEAGPRECVHAIMQKLPLNG